MLSSSHPSHGALLHSFAVWWWLAFDIKRQREWCTVDEVILVIPKNGVRASHIMRNLPEVKTGVAYQKLVAP